MDPSAEKGAGSADRSCAESSEERRSCADCRTTKTPLWRGGPSGPKSLCNACGIRYRKRAREAMGLKGGEAARKEKKRGKEEGGGGERRMGVALKMRMEGFGGELVLKETSFLKKKRRWRRRAMGEEEKAAVLLMALSSGLLHA